ncbi:unnamed protein product [Effrenium voratum]|uniref:Uncharacterized protein n=1 Tax=Effrenium voratum TaxID=2562239 RepID=A0AA36IWU3_9DINO|nr:unnamed protein product [Effrenium voratum]
MAMKRPAAGARKRPAAAAAPAPGSRNRLCAAEGCKFNPQRSGQRAEVLRGKDFDRCIVCGPDAFREAASTGKGGGVIARFLNKLAKADPGVFEEAVVKLQAEHPLETVQKYEKQARRKAREAAGREAEAACAPRHRLCAGEGCKFNVACLGERAEVPQNTDLRLCVICGPDTFREAAKGQGAARFLNKLAKLDLGVFEEAAAQLKAQHSEDVVDWLVERAREDTAWATTRAQRFRAWCLSKSWRMCGQCGRMVAQPFKAQHAAGRDRAPAEMAACQHCKSEGRQGYWSPLPQDQPRRLRNLKPEVVEALRPLNIHAGPQQRMPHGYAVHGDMLRFSFKPQGVLEQVDLLPKKLKKKAKKALKHLLRSEDNAYGEFLELRYKFLHTRARGIERASLRPPASRIAYGLTCTGCLPLPKWLANYMTCTWRAPAMTCLEFLRKAGPDGQIQQRYRRIHKHLRVEAPLEEWINVCAESGEVLVSPVFYTRLGDEYCGQWLLLNVPFLALDDLWLRRALRVPERLRFLALCLLHKPAYWRSPARVRADLELEARAETYIRNALDMLAARIELVDAYLLGELRVEDVLTGRTCYGHAHVM